MNQNQDTEPLEDSNKETKYEYLEVPWIVCKASPKPLFVEQGKDSVFDRLSTIAILLTELVLLPVKLLLNCVNKKIPAAFASFKGYSELDDPTSLASLALKLKEPDLKQNVENEPLDDDSNQETDNPSDEPKYLKIPLWVTYATNEPPLDTKTFNAIGLISFSEWIKNLFSKG